MKITELRIENFRCFKKAKLRIAPVTLITGANSAGKSSLVAPLLAWAQTDGMPALLSPHGHHVEMGGFSEMVHGGDEEGEIGIGLNVQPRRPAADPTMTIDATFGDDVASSGPRLRELEISGTYFRVCVAQADDTYELAYDVRPADSKALRDNVGLLEYVRDRPHSGDAESSRMIAQAYDPLRVRATNDPSRYPIIYPKNQLRGRLELSDASELIRVAYWTEDLSGSFVARRIAELPLALQDDLIFISSFRLAPRRTYYEVAKANLAVGRHGENYVEQIAQWTSANAQQLDHLRNDLGELGILSALEIGRLGAGRMELRGRPKPNARMTNLTDLGFGTSQVLPVLVAVNQLHTGSVFVVAQPETHLHPEAQARLASYFVRLAKTRGITFIVETHSEYLINRLRRLVANGEIEEDDVSVAHVENMGREAQVHPVELRADGQIVGAPKDFFETHMMDVMKLAMGE